MGEIEPDEGSVKWGVSTIRSYLPKDNSAYFDGNDMELVDWLRQYSAKKDDVYLRGFLGRMLFSNEDRHLNNIAVLRCGDGFDYCPIFDFGAGLLSNTRDYPMEIEPAALVRQLKAQPMKTGFVRQVHAAQNLYGPQLRCDFAEKEIMAALSEPLEFYAKRDAPYIRDRVTACIKFQRKKLF